MNRQAITDSYQSLFQLGLDKYALSLWYLHGLINNEAFSGGPAGLVYGFILVWAGTAAVFASLSELASMYV